MNSEMIKIKSDIINSIELDLYELSKDISDNLYDLSAPNIDGNKDYLRCNAKELANLYIKGYSIIEDIYSLLPKEVIDNFIPDEYQIDKDKSYKLVVKLDKNTIKELKYELNSLLELKNEMAQDEFELGLEIEFLEEEISSSKKKIESLRSEIDLVAIKPENKLTEEEESNAITKLSFFKNKLVITNFALDELREKLLEAKNSRIIKQNKIRVVDNEIHKIKNKLEK